MYNEPFKSTYVNCFKRLRFLADVSTKLHKRHFFRQFKNHNSERKHGNSTMTPFVSSTVNALTVCNIHFCIWKYSKFISMWFPLRSILVWSVKATDRRTFLESRHPGLTKNLYYVLSNYRSQIPISLGSSSWTKSICC